MSQARRAEFQTKEGTSMPEYGYKAIFTPEKWVRPYLSMATEPEGAVSWDVTEHVRANPDYWTEMVGEERAHGDPSDDYAWTYGVLDRDAVLKADPNAPQWVRDWRGPFTIRVYRPVR